MQSFDLIVIGSGPAGQRAAIQGAKFGKRVAVVERRECVGGACINTGTIPSKTLREAVMHLSGYAYQGIYGVNYRVKDKITMADLAFRVQHVIKTEIDVTVSQLTRNGVTTLMGSASFTDPHTIRIESVQGSIDYHAENIVIATGTKPAASPKVPYNNRTIINSDQILNMPEVPKTFIVVGGGVIGVEGLAVQQCVERMPKQDAHTYCDHKIREEMACLGAAPPADRDPRKSDESQSSGEDDRDVGRTDERLLSDLEAEERVPDEIEQAGAAERRTEEQDDRITLREHL